MTIEGYLSLVHKIKTQGLQTRKYSRTTLLCSHYTLINYSFIFFFPDLLFVKFQENLLFLCLERHRYFYVVSVMLRPSF